MEDYIAMKQRQQAEIDAFPFGCAFNEWQYKVMMEGWGLDPEADKDKIARVFSGTFVKKSDLETFREMMNRHDAEMRAAINADKTGKGWAYDAMKYELGNHEYYYSGEDAPVLAALGLKRSDLDADVELLETFNLAIRDYMCETSRAEDALYEQKLAKQKEAGND